MVVAIQAVVRVAAAVAFLQLHFLFRDQSHLRLAGEGAAVAKARVLALGVGVWVSWVRTSDMSPGASGAGGQGYLGARKQGRTYYHSLVGPIRISMPLMKCLDLLRRPPAPAALGRFSPCRRLGHRKRGGWWGAGQGCGRVRRVGGDGRSGDGSSRDGRVVSGGVVGDRGRQGADGAPEPCADALAVIVVHVTCVTSLDDQG